MLGFVEKLSKPKSAGGLGFRKIVQFNDALLTKLSWRVLKNLNSLLAKILLGKYCVQSSFLDAHPLLNASHGLCGLLVGRDLLAKGLEWSIC